MKNIKGTVPVVIFFLVDFLNVMENQLKKKPREKKAQLRK
jgi:hypothetical protein